MRIVELVLSGSALALAAVLIAPQPAAGWATLGSDLDVNDRDVRVFNNFSDADANDNTTQTGDWPGYDGAELALWKGAAEWASEAHGLSGAGDPTQPVIGSGVANFDISWQGNATAVGGPSANTMSEISGAFGGVAAFTEAPNSTGWRIRFYAKWDWSDGPDIPGDLNLDLQGVACHEYGHALGLAHSSSPSATMFASLLGIGVIERSINSDDLGGIQSVYGVRDPGVKPHIESIAGTGQPFVITGTQFQASGNEVWFTQAAAGGNGSPVKVTGLASNGTTITVFAPPAAGPGDLQVRKPSVSGHKGLSNAFPVYPLLCGSGSVNYCTPGTSASGCQASLSSTGTPSASSGSSFIIDAVNLEGNKDGLLFFGTGGRQANSWGNGTSLQCVVPPVKRTGTQLGNGTNGACDGTLSLDFNAWMVAHPAGTPPPGTGVNVQAWYRDPLNTSNQTTSLSDGLEFVICN